MHWVAPLKDKNGVSIVNTFQGILIKFIKRQKRYG